MQVSVETLNGLERKMTISVPSEKLEEEVDLRLKNLSRKAKIDGFRPGKVPLTVVKKRFSESVREEVARDMVQSTLYEALKTHDLMPAGAPFVEPERLEPGKDFKYTAVFEVFPTIEIQELNKANTDVIHAEVQEADVTDMLDKLREQNKEWKEVSRPVAQGDKVVIDFQGFLDGELFAGGSAKQQELIIGSGTMIPGFEDGLIGAKQDKECDVSVTFPKDYGSEELAGKEALFKITVTRILAGELPELNDAFAEKFNIKEGGIDALMKDIKQNMERELDRRLSTMNREKAFDALLQKNKIDLPKALIDQEIGHLKHEMYHRIFGHEHSENEQIPDFPRNLFEAQAERRVHLGLLFSEYVKKHAMVVEKERVDAMIEKFASAYESPEELRAWYQGSKERLAEVEALVMEEMVAEQILKDATIVNKTMKYDEVMNPKANQEDKGE